MSDMTNLEPLEALTGAAAEYVADCDHLHSGEVDDSELDQAYQDANTTWAAWLGVLEGFASGGDESEDDLASARLVATFAPLIDEVRRLREIALDASVLSIQQTICEDSTFKSDEDAEEAFGLLYAAWATLREHLKGGES